MCDVTIHYVNKIRQNKFIVLNVVYACRYAVKGYQSLTTTIPPYCILSCHNMHLVIMHTDNLVTKLIFI